MWYLNFVDKGGGRFDDMSIVWLSLATVLLAVKYDNIRPRFLR